MLKPTSRQAEGAGGVRGAHSSELEGRGRPELMESLFSHPAATGPGETHHEGTNLDGGKWGVFR